MPRNHKESLPEQVQKEILRKHVTEDYLKNDPQNVGGGGKHSSI